MKQVKASPEVEVIAPKTASKTTANKEFLAAILIRSTRGMRQDIKDTVFMLRLRKKNSCSVLADNAETKGMIKKAKDFITFGTISEKDLEHIEKSKLKRKKFNTTTIFFLHPPRGGFERKGIKVPFGQGGALGDRKDKIAELINRMM